MKYHVRYSVCESEETYEYTDFSQPLDIAMSIVESQNNFWGEGQYIFYIQPDCDVINYLDRCLKIDSYIKETT